MSKPSSPITTFRLFLLTQFKDTTVAFDDIRGAVRKQFPSLCNDAVLCTHETPRRPEWQHQLRQALDYLKNKKKVISQQSPGDYIFP